MSIRTATMILMVAITTICTIKELIKMKKNEKKFEENIGRCYTRYSGEV